MIDFVRPDRWRERLRQPFLCLALIVIGSFLLPTAGCKQISPEEQAQQELAKARERARQGKKNEAIIQYRRAIQTDPKLAVSHFELGKLYEEQDDYINAVQQLN